MGWRGSMGLVVLLVLIAMLTLVGAGMQPPAGVSPTMDLWMAAIASGAAVVGWLVRNASTTRPAMAIGWVCALILAVMVATRTAPEGRILYAMGFVVLSSLLAGVLSGLALAIHVGCLVLVMLFALDVVAGNDAVRVGGALALAMVALVLYVSALVKRQDALIRCLREDALRDPLTGAWNRRGAALEAAAVHAVAARFAARPNCVAVFDVDGFKSYNDSFGHSLGDRLLVALVQSWRTRMRAGDILARMGGDEFAVVLVGATRTQAVRVIERLADHAPASWSYGISEWRHGESFQHALDRADRELYARRALGRGYGTAHR